MASIDVFRSGGRAASSGWELDTDTPPDTSGSLCPPDHSDLLVIVNKSDGTSTAADKAFYVQVD